jgi:hypothetical protein
MEIIFGAKRLVPIDAEHKTKASVRDLAKRELIQSVIQDCEVESPCSSYSTLTDCFPSEHLANFVPLLSLFRPNSPAKFNQQGVLCV